MGKGYWRYRRVEEKYRLSFLFSILGDRFTAAPLAIKARLFSFLPITMVFVMPRYPVQLSSIWQVHTTVGFELHQWTTIGYKKYYLNIKISVNNYIIFVHQESSTHIDLQLVIVSDQLTVTSYCLPYTCRSSNSLTTRLRRRD
jgi:hypothetical protein